MNPKEVLALIRSKEVKAVDLRFMDFPGLWQHFTIPAEALEESVFDEGLGFDPGEVPDPTAIENLERPCGRSRARISLDNRPRVLSCLRVPTWWRACSNSRPVRLLDRRNSKRPGLACQRAARRRFPASRSIADPFVPANP